MKRTSRIASARHRQSRQPEHLPPRDIARRREALRQRFAELGPLAVRFLEGLLSAQRCGWDHAQKVLTLLGIYRREDLLIEAKVRVGYFLVRIRELRQRAAAVRQAELQGNGELDSPDGRLQIAPRPGFSPT